MLGEGKVGLAAVLISKADQVSAVEALIEADELLANRKRKIRIADGSKLVDCSLPVLAATTSLKTRAKRSYRHRQKIVKIAEHEAVKKLKSRKRKRRVSNGSDTSSRVKRRLFRCTGRPTHFILLYYFSLHIPMLSEWYLINQFYVPEYLLYFVSFSVLVK